MQIWGFSLYSSHICCFKLKLGLGSMKKKTTLTLTHFDDNTLNCFEHQHPSILYFFILFYFLGFGNWVYTGTFSAIVIIIFLSRGWSPAVICRKLGGNGKVNQKSPVKVKAVYANDFWAPHRSSRQGVWSIRCFIFSR